MKSEGFVFINEDGQFLVLSERTTHTGRHVITGFTSDLNAAYVAQRLDYKVLQQYPQLHKLPVEVEVVRSTKIKCKNVGE